MRQVPRRDMLMIMGEFNARVGNDAATWLGTIGRFGPGEQNENRVRLLDFCSLNGLVITNTIFKHCPCHQHTCLLKFLRLVLVMCYSMCLSTSVFSPLFLTLECTARLIWRVIIRLKLKARRRRVSDTQDIGWMPGVWRSSRSWISGPTGWIGRWIGRWPKG